MGLPPILPIPERVCRPGKGPNSMNPWPNIYNA